MAQIRKVAPGRSAVMITGETGTGKEMVARAIHAESGRKGPFVPVNCGALRSDQLAQSELFGYVKGAFTDARDDRLGVFCKAHGGTILLDEFGELQPQAQVDLLRVLQERAVKPVGSDREVAIDVCALGATHRDLDALERTGALREDLRFRMDVARVHLPPLRERTSDIPALAARLAQVQGHDPGMLSQGFMDAVSRRPLRGNVRELNNLIERAFIAAPGRAQVLATHLDPLDKTSAQQGSLPTDDAQTIALSSRTMQEVRNEALRMALIRHQGNAASTARALGIDERTVRRWIERHGES